MLKVNERISIPLREFEFSFVRSSGPGGQNVNKVNTKACLTWKIESSKSIPVSVKNRFCKKYSRRISKEGVFFLSSQRYRDQGRNVADCLTKLQEMIREAAVVPKARRKTKPSARAKQRRLDQKRQNSEKKSARRSVRLD